MKLATFRHCGSIAYGVVDGDLVHIISAHLPDIPHLRAALLRFGAEIITEFRRRIGTVEQVPLERVELLAPIPNPTKFLALGGNYMAHRAESETAAVASQFKQVWFNKQVSCVGGPYQDVVKPSVSDQFDYEGELGVVIGRRCRAVAANDAASVIAGYVVCNDLSVRDWQMRSPTTHLGKSFDTHGPIGPWLVTPDEFGEPGPQMLTTRVNGEIRQQARLSDMVVPIAEMIEELSASFTLEPGDILSTGTPAGVGKAFDPPRFLIPGDIVSVEIERIGTIRNKVVAEVSPVPPQMPAYEI